ncbi:TTK protein kinase [Pseudogymnoascus sp. 23342-1-I1]|nr:TTK protein kinase [Pseudogymnoascus sp. 23342-1-I1]
MATASPTPLGSSHFGTQQMRRPSSRQALRQVPARPTFVRREAAAINGNPSAEQPMSRTRRYSDHDSSDDDLPVPMKFSALTNALLNDEASMLGSASPVVTNNEHNLSGSTAVAQRHTYTEPPAPEQMARESTASPAMVSRTHSPYPRRVVRLSGTPSSASLRRTTSLSNSVRAPSEQVPSRPGSPLDLSTPAPYPRTVRIPITASSNHGSLFGSSGRASNRIGSGARSAALEQEEMEDPATVARPYNATSLGSVTRYGSSTANRTRYGEEAGMQSSMRVKRLGKAGSFLSGPARRGKRRQSEEEQGPGQDAESAESALSSQERQSQEPESQAAENHDGGSGEAASSQELEAPKSSFYSASQYRDFASGSPMSGREALKQARTSPPIPVYNRPADPVVEQARPPPSDYAPPAQPAQPVFKLPAPRPEMPSNHDQENEAPPTFKRNKAPPSVLLDKIDKVPLRQQSADLSAMRTVSPVRQPLAARSQNTPRRPAPPPPKMSLLETATATAGAATTSHSSKKRNNIRVNGKSYTRLEILGRGGSSKVWRVMAENGKIYALKRVSLENADENAVRGYKGEIDLLKKLEGNDRVVTILDYEMNDEKKMLSVLMEMGELDFNRILGMRYNTENAVFDPSFTRYYWREMLVCIAAVHSHDIVHSDLKPANFVLAKGLLKLIDFGIANAIQTDETVNVHRDSQVGTTNYMSPESLMDSSELPENKAPGAMRGHSSGPRVMKLGKPSDIWSLGCILYQMAYGHQPFAHISNQLSRCRAIIDWNYAIEYPSRGLGGVTLPQSLIRLLKRCLERDQRKRPTAAELLSEQDEFLNPRELPGGALPMTEELLGRILLSVVGKCKGREVGDAEVMNVWAGAYFESLKKNLGT